ncbi:hypothetical protein A4S06_09575 [Erysipelotrichaceae bacterium MTC7]|nr:hypothetical protein A4S06_09575 [Erysipelotrichaceae bacterium MTC7]
MMNKREETRNNKKQEITKTEILSFVKMVLICFVLVFLCVKFFFRPITVSGISMYPTLEDKEFGFSNVFSAITSDLQRFEVVVVQDEKTGDDLWVKRVIGLPGDEIEYFDDQLYVNGEPVEEPFLNKKYMEDQIGQSGYGNNFTNDLDPFVLGEDEYFLMGDNRPVSRDSRAVGPFKGQAIVSKYVLVLYPFDKIGLVTNNE